MLVGGNRDGVATAPQGGADPDKRIDVARAANGNKKEVLVNLGRG